MFGFSRKVTITGFIAIAAVIIIIITTVFLLMPNHADKKAVKNSWEDKFIGTSKLGVYTKAAVSTTGKECAEIGLSILKKNGSAVDAAISALLCEGVSSLHSSGLGGGFLMTIWDRKTGEATFLNARETAPARATKDMFGGNSSLSMYGGLAVAVPGELKGYWEAHEKYGNLQWKELFTPVIELCERGSHVNSYLADTLRRKLPLISAEPTLAELLINPKTNSTWIEGDRIKRPLLRDTLRTIAEHGIDNFYNGTMGENIVKEIQSFGGIIQMDDLRNYTVEWKKPITTRIGNLTLHTAALPGSGVLLSFMLNILENFGVVAEEKIFYQRLLETFKWAYARRTELGDDAFGHDLAGLIKNLTSKNYAAEIRRKIRDNWTNNDPKFYGVQFEPVVDSGTAHVSVLAADGSAVSVTSTINQVLGAMRRSKSTGIIFNDEMDDFSSANITNAFNLPPSPANYISPGKRPLSSMTPSIIVDNSGEVQMVIGAAGGTKITTGVALALVLNLWAGYSVKEAVDARRIHHQALPMKIEAEENFSPKILKFLAEIKHEVTHYAGLGSAVTAISRLNHPGITANSDYRRGGGIAGY